MVSFSITSFSRVEFGSSMVLLLMASYRSDLTCSLINLSVHLQVPHFFCWFCKCFNCSHLFHKEIDFIKATDHLSTDHLPIDPRTTDQDQLTHWSKNHRPTDKIMFKWLEVWRHSFYRMQTQLEKWKAILRPIIYLNRIKVFDRITFVFITLNIRKRNGLVNCVYFLAKDVTAYSSTFFLKICFSFLLAVVLIKFNEAIRNIPSELNFEC